MQHTTSAQTALYYPSIHPSIHPCMSHQSEQTGVPSRCVEDHEAAFQLLSVQPPQLDLGPPITAADDSTFPAAI